MRLASSILAVLLPIAAAPAAFCIDDVTPFEPAGGATVGERPVFRFHVKGDWKGVGQAKIELSRDRWKTVEKSWDMRESMAGWGMIAEEDEKGGLFRCTEAIPEGDWEWRVTVFQNGAQYDGARTAAFRVDATPPAEVEGLRMKRVQDGSIVLTWDPVIYDVEGRPETVDHYVVYRYNSKGVFLNAKGMEAGESSTTSFTDKSPMKTTTEIVAEASKAKAKEEAAAAKKSGGATGKPAVVPDAGRTGPAGQATPQPGPDTAGALIRSKPPKGFARSDLEGEHRAIFYKIVAVDVAGNELGRRTGTMPAWTGENPEKVRRRQLLQILQQQNGSPSPTPPPSPPPAPADSSADDTSGNP